MLPEQVWDHADMPSEGMYFGRSAGSAQPLVWAHAEYIKLLRSVADGKVFDRISVVEERYAVPPGTRTFRSTHGDLPDGAAHRADASAGRRCASSTRTLQRRPTRSTTGRPRSRPSSHGRRLPGLLCRHPHAEMDPSGTGKLIFTMHWPARPEQTDHWLGRNYRGRCWRSRRRRSARRPRCQVETGELAIEAVRWYTGESTRDANQTHAVEVGSHVERAPIYS